MRGVVLALCFVALSALPASAEPWKCGGVLYGWLAGLEGAIGVAGTSGQPVDASFEDLAGYVDFAMAGHFEARKPKTVLLLDVSYTGLGSERDAMVGNQPVEIDLDIDQWIIELSGGYPASKEIDLLLAARYYILDAGGATTSIVGSSTTENTQNWGDIYVGARYLKRFQKHWQFSIRGDVGTGGSDFAWFGEAFLGYRISDRFMSGAGWRVLSLDYEGDGGASYFKYDITQNGLGIGLGYTF